MTDITVIIPTKDRLWSLPKAVSSCRNSPLDTEIIVIDDESTDGTAAWLRSQPDVSVIRGEGWGKPWGVNKAMAHATGRYVRFLDSDDWLSSGANEVQFRIAEREQADVVVAGVDNYREEVLVDTMPWIPTDDFIAQQLGETPGSHYSAFLFRREFVRDIPHRTLFPASDFASRDDRCFILEVALRHPKISVCQTSTLCHRHHQEKRLQFHEGLRRDGSHIQTLFIYRQVLRLLDHSSQLTPRRKTAAFKVLWPLAHWIAYTHLDEACELVRWIYEMDPTFQPLETGLLGRLYRRLGFRTTERVLGMRRAVFRGLHLR